MKASRILFSDIEKKFGNMAFTLRSLENEQKARMGVVECVKHKLLEPYGVLYDKEKEFIAQFKFTVLLMPSGSKKITGLTFDPSIYESEHQIVDESLKSTLNKGISKSVNKKKKKTNQKLGQQAEEQTATAATGDEESGGK